MERIDESTNANVKSGSAELKSFFAGLRAGLEEISNFNFINENSWKENQNDLKKHWDTSFNNFRKIDGFDNRDNSVLEKLREVELYKFEIMFPSLQRQSSLVMIISYLENSLNELCDIVSNLTKSRIKPVDFGNRTSIDRSLKYLDLVGNFHMLELKNSNEWHYVKRIRKLRNKIVHYGSSLNCDESGYILKGDDLNSFVEKNPYLMVLDGSRNSINSKYIFKIEEGFAEEAISELFKFVKLLETAAFAPFLAQFLPADN